MAFCPDSPGHRQNLHTGLIHESPAHRHPLSEVTMKVRGAIRQDAIDQLLTLPLVVTSELPYQRPTQVAGSVIERSRLPVATFVARDGHLT